MKNQNKSHQEHQAFDEADTDKRNDLGRKLLESKPKQSTNQLIMLDGKQLRLCALKPREKKSLASAPLMG